MNSEEKLHNLKLWVDSNLEKIKSKLSEVETKVERLEKENDDIVLPVMKEQRNILIVKKITFNKVKKMLE